MAKLRDGRGWLLRDGERVARLEIAASANRRTRGLLGRDGLTGALLISPCNGVHTFRMRFPIDVLFLDKAWTVIDLVQMKPNRVGKFRMRARHVIEAEWGSFEQWGVGPGAQLDVEYQTRKPRPQGEE